MVERGTLLRCCTFTGTEGSNPSLSAMNFKSNIERDEKFTPGLIRGIPPSPPFIKEWLVQKKLFDRIFTFI